jgi:hypothetical protein
MIIAAILPLKVSVMLSAILTAALLFLAIRENFLLWFVAFAAAAMIWRGEAWKAAFLEAE